MPRLIPLSPEEELVEAYRQAYLDLVQTIKRKQAKGSLAHFERELLADVTRILQGLDGNLKRWIETQLPQVVVGGAETAIEAYIKAGIDVPPVSASFAKVNESAVRTLAQNLAGNLREAHSFVGRVVQDEWRRVGLELITSKTTTGRTVQQAKKMMMQRIGDNGLGAFQDSRGRVWRLDSYSEMVVRTTTREATKTRLMTQLEDMGRDLVKITWHVVTCGICAPYAGRVYSISGRDKRFPPLSSVPGFDKGYKTIHGNCRHVLTPYIEELANNPEEDIQRSNKPFEDTRSGAQIEAYNKTQTEKRQRMADRKQWESYRAWLPEDAPKSLSGFRKMKAINSDRYQELQRQYREVRAGANP